MNGEVEWLVATCRLDIDDGDDETWVMRGEGTYLILERWIISASKR
jgi:hypothetical protein